MMQISSKLVLFSMCFSLIGATDWYWPYTGCPAPYYHYPHQEDGYPVCAWWWNGNGNDWPVDACNGDRYYAQVGDFESGYGYEPMGSIYVMPGCTMYLYEDFGFAGNREEIYDGLLPNNPYFASNGVIPGPKSYKCRCYYPINCVPKDSYEVILQYDNKKGKTPITLTYMKTIGLSLSAEIQKSLTQTNTTTTSITRRFLWLFSLTNTWSSTTSYKWEAKVAADFSVTKSLESKITIQPGKTIQILQAVGKCGDSEVRTSLFKVKTLKDQ